MAILKDVMAYIIQHYPHSEELSNARLTKMVYLSDWHQSINLKRQITSIEWYFDNYGPFVWDIDKEAKANPDLFRIQSTNNYYGGNKSLYTLRTENYKPSLSKEESSSIDHVIEETKRLHWRQFINLVYSTYPIISSEKYSKLNLVEKAKEYADVT